MTQFAAFSMGVAKRKSSPMLHGFGSVFCATALATCSSSSCFSSWGRFSSSASETAETGRDSLCFFAKRPPDLRFDFFSSRWEGAGEGTAVVLLVVSVISAAPRKGTGAPAAAAAAGWVVVSCAGTTSMSGGMSAGADIVVGVLLHELVG